MLWERSGPEFRAIADEFGIETGFEIIPFRKLCLINGLDDICRTMKDKQENAEFDN